ncbi:MAG: WYL domain-containing protein [Butyrivibrio sp.]|nr:WYL domain-containing protein [Butyrivibrio sp.]
MSTNSRRLKRQSQDRPALEDYSDLKNIFKQYETSLIVYVLKRVSDIDHALSCAEISGCLSLMMGGGSEDTDFFNTRTTSRKMKLCDEIADSSDEYLKYLNSILLATYGGRIRYREADSIFLGKSNAGKGSQKRYYFEPLLSCSDMELIYGTLRSSRYLSDAEKLYLLERLSLIHPEPSYPACVDASLSGSELSIPHLKDRPKYVRSKDAVPFPGRDSIFLRNVEIISSAIEKKIKIDVVYGIYDYSPDTSAPIFHERNRAGDPYVLNPYALIWNDGEYYMIASFDKYDGPTHFRVDRIISVKPHVEMQKDNTQKETKRKAIPLVLREFYEKDPEGHIFFDGIKYSNTYPGMAIHKHTHKTTCTFECTNWSLQMLVDNFGPNISLKPSERIHAPSEVDYNGRPQQFLLATIHNVEYDNAVRFAVERCEYLTLLSPKKMVMEVKEVLTKAANRLS